ncbi:MAG: DUF2608 domain-containing protein [Alphaproteobacteria bacterium]|nr:DUF2608 domain-containing protein [Alphaproteobacteria bacterium]
MKNYLNEIKLSIKIGLMVLIGLSAFEASAEIVQASSVNDIKTYTSQHFQAILKNFQGKEIALVKDKEVPMAEYLISQILFTSKFELVSPDMPNFINELDKKMTVVGFTANSSGKYGIVQNEAELHLSRLNSLGYHFKDNGDLLKGEFPECISRVIFANKADKGKVLLGFLKQLNKNYKNIIFVDDRLKNLTSVQNIVKDHEINYLGVHYTELKDKNEVLNQDIADKQFQVLSQEYIWLSDDEAQARLNIKPD